MVKKDFVWRQAIIAAYSRLKNWQRLKRRVRAKMRQKSGEQGEKEGKGTNEAKKVVNRAKRREGARMRPKTW